MPLLTIGRKDVKIEKLEWVRRAFTRVANEISEFVSGRKRFLTGKGENMQTVRYSGGKISELGAGCVVALGLFDGVHIAHRMLLERARCEAERLGVPFVVFTFPQESKSLKRGVLRLYSTEEKLRLLEGLAVDICILCDFEAVRDMSKERFVDELLIGSLGARVAVCGYNFTYGSGGAGNATTLADRLRKWGAEAIVIDEKKYFDEEISTSEIRARLQARDLRGASRLLGGAYFITGTVVHGRGDGRSFGIPTMNVDLDDGLFSLGSGVYATAVIIDGVRYLSLTNLGTCPTFGERDAHAECFVLDYEGNLYGKNVRIYFLEFLREEKRFGSKEELIMQINIDKNRVYSLEGEGVWQELGLR